MISRAATHALIRLGVDGRPLALAAIAMLIVAGLVFSMAGSPPVAERLHLPTFYFVNRQALFLMPALLVMFGVSFLSPRHVRRAALVMFIYRWRWSWRRCSSARRSRARAAGFSAVQPSEFLKPAFVVLVAWAFSEGAARKDVPGNIIALALFPLTVVPLGAAAGLRPDHADLDGLGDPVLHGGAALALGRRHWRRSARPRLCSPINSCRTCTRASRHFSSRRRR